MGARRHELTINADLNFWMREVEHQKAAVEYYRTTKTKAGWGFRGTKEGLRRSMVEHQKLLVEAQERVETLLEEYKASRS